MDISRDPRSREVGFGFAESTSLHFLDVQIVKDRERGETRNVVSQGQLVDGELEALLLTVSICLMCST